jgi:hypothetical protein
VVLVGLFQAPDRWKAKILEKLGPLFLLGTKLDFLAYFHDFQLRFLGFHQRAELG